MAGYYRCAYYRNGCKATLNITLSPEKGDTPSKKWVKHTCEEHSCNKKVNIDEKEKNTEIIAAIKQKNSSFTTTADIMDIKNEMKELTESLSLRDITLLPMDVAAIVMNEITTKYKGIVLCIHS